MNEIILLSQDTIDKIAAGEVVERPASVVKELVENAVDAGANAITVEIKDGGTSLVRITDNGCGIPKEQVRIAYQQHATSKIRKVEDLLTSGTLGFRGEALSSIAAVSQVEMITKTAGSLTGVRYVIEGGSEKNLEEIGAPEGTTFLVHNLFFNTPARKKFLKSASGEAGCVSDLMERMALSHPEIAFKFISNRDTKLHTSGNCNLKDIIYSIYGRDIASNLLKIDADYGNIKITGFIGKPVISRGNRNYENYFVNDRYVKSAIVARAIEDAYKAFMMSHRYPFTVLKLQIDTEEVDVNVHPQKMEVRFSNQQDVYEKVCQAVKEALLGKELIPEFTIERPAGQAQKKNDTAASGHPEGAETGKKHIDVVINSGASPDRPASTAAQAAASGQHAEKNGVFSNSVGDQTGKSAHAISESADIPYKESANLEKKSAPRYPEPFEKIRNQLIAEANSPYQAKYPQRDRRASMKPVTGSILPSGETKIRKAGDSAGEAAGQSPDEAFSHPLPSSVSDALKEDAARTREEELEKKAVQMELFGEKLLSESSRPRHRLVGQVFDTYWIVEFDDKMYLIDQHAAHEKVMYERFMKQYHDKKQTSQMITPPVIVTLNLQEEELLKRHMTAFTDVGFEISPFGGREYAVSAVPGNLYSLASRDLFLEILDGLSSISEQASDQIVCEKIASMSCKAAVKGGSRLSTAEANALIDELLQLENPYNCPHGRPTIVTMTKYELEKKFKRVL